MGFACTSDGIASKLGVFLVTGQIPQHNCNRLPHLHPSGSDGCRPNSECRNFEHRAPSWARLTSLWESFECFGRFLGAKRMNFLHTFHRTVATSAAMGRQRIPVFSASKQSKIMSKLVHGRDKGRRQWHENNIPSGTFDRAASAQAISNPRGHPKHVLRRVTVLNKLFMRNIADIMSTGELSQEIVGKGLEISRVKVSPDFRQAYVYWLAKGTEEDEELESMLSRIAGRLRHELSQLRLMGEVPKIIFLKDFQHSKFSDVDRLLAKADFGEDFEPLYMGQKPKEAIAQDKNEIFPSSAALPEMRQDVFGLNHADIMQRITRTLSRTRSAWEKYEFGAEPEEQVPGIQRPDVDFESRAERNAQLEKRFNQFLISARNRPTTPERKRHQPEIHVIPRDESPEEPVDNSLFEEDDFDEWPEEKP
ncbi:uncharacterized protein LOC132265177 [Phlebotomus argentipes]|uniref:uncharacterized protein LOC132265177 n=1 Tax=Phlebotomus argentipes TaxID=94469 RepID=UPI002892BA6D|nr:uncharacterized protein LOC132265177 [Phlebotomus argentipes]